MQEIVIRSIRRSTIQLRVRRLDFEYFWPYWNEPLDKYMYWRRPVGRKSLKIVEAKYPGRDWEFVGFAAPGRGRYPNKIRVLDVEFNIGGPVRLYDRKVLVASYTKDNATWFLHDMQHHTIRAVREDVFPYRSYKEGVRLEFPGGVRLNYEQALRLSVGRVVRKPQRLHLDGECVTDGDLEFPLVRPHGLAQWNNHYQIRFAQGIKSINWKLFLRAIIGQYVSDIVEESQLRPVVRRRMGEVERRELNRKREEKIGECFTDHRTVQSVAVGRNVIFTLHGEKTIFIVDSPEYATALYVFDEYRHAYSWASRAIDWREARKLARMVKIHRGAWRDEVAAALEPCTV